MVNRSEVSRVNDKSCTGALRREPDTEEARALTWSTRPLRFALRSEAREGASEGSHRCMAVSNESEAP